MEEPDVFERLRTLNSINSLDADKLLQCKQLLVQFTASVTKDASGVDNVLDAATIPMLFPVVAVSPTFADNFAFAKIRATLLEIYELNAILLDDALRMKPFRNQSDDTRLSLLPFLVALGDEEAPWTNVSIATRVGGLKQQLLREVGLKKCAQHLLENHVKPALRSKDFGASRTTERGSINYFPRNKTNYFFQSDQTFRENAWPFSPAITRYLDWSLDNLKGSEIEEHWGLIVPPVMILLENERPELQLEGDRLLHNLLCKISKDIMKRTGIRDVFWETILPFLNYLPPLTEESQSVKFISTSVSNLLLLSEFTDAPDEQCRMLRLVLRDNILRAFVYSGEKVGIAMALFDAMGQLITVLGIECVRYLEQLLDITGTAMTNPLSPVHKGYLELALQTFLLVLEKCAPRIENHWERILQYAVVCWANVSEEPGCERCKDLLVKIITQLEAAKSGHQKWVLTKARFTDVDPQLRQLLPA